MGPPSHPRVGRAPMDLAMAKDVPMAKGLGVRILTLLVAALLSLRAAAAPDPLAVPEGARGESGFDEGEPRVEARLLALPDDTGVPGDFQIGVLFDLDPG